ncbi:zinc ribbon domain-containing protein [bacterium]|nr:zinc ribbon domain-containing protein [bacterium]
MPLFEYHCPDCDSDFDELRKHSDRDEQIACPDCKSRRPARKVSLFSSSGMSAGSSGGGCGSPYPGRFT